MSKLNSKQTQYLLLVLVIVVFFAAYRFGFSPIMDKANEIKDVNAELQTKVDELNDVKANETTYRDELAQAQAGVDGFVKAYPAGMTPQKTLFIVKQLEEAAAMDVTSVSFTDPEVLFTSTFVNDAGENVIASNRQFTINFTTTYDGLKKAVDFINNNVDHMTMRNITAASNQETGQIIGSMAINEYYATGLGREYEEPAVGDVPLSVNGIFNTIR
ncbi:MAG: hypothetical protein SOW12_07350 [Lachnospiraceae bacterium]|nr:hypothetical protein [Lachnoclostridium sp.]MDD7522013.1 hypothetical protein [Lachnoclostridium sp.]MDY2599730.1 hypothetical protein [Lachnospiraceae bacterium]